MNLIYTRDDSRIIIHRLIRNLVYSLARIPSEHPPILHKKAKYALNQAEAYRITSYEHDNTSTT